MQKDGKCECDGDSWSCCEITEWFVRHHLLFRLLISQEQHRVFTLLPKQVQDPSGKYKCLLLLPFKRLLVIFTSFMCLPSTPVCLTIMSSIQPLIQQPCAVNLYVTVIINAYSNSSLAMARDKLLLIL